MYEIYVDNVLQEEVKDYAEAVQKTTEARKRKHKARWEYTPDVTVKVVNLRGVKRPDESNKKAQVLATADIEICHCMMLTGIKFIAKLDGDPFLAYPEWKEGEAGNGNIWFPINKETYKLILKEIETKYVERIFGNKLENIKRR